MAKGKGRNFQKILVSQTVQGGMSSEEKQEEVKRWNQNNKLLAKIEENTRGVGGGGDPRVEPDAGGAGIAQIGIISAMVAASLGTLVGAIQGHIAAIKWFGSKMIPSSVIKNLTSSMDATRKFFSDGVAKVRNFVKGIMDGFTKMFKSDGLGKMSQMLTRGVDAIKDFFKPITEAMKYVRSGGGFISNLMKTVRGGIASVMNFFGGLGKFFGSFGAVFAGFAAVAKKIFLPLTVVMTIWDTVKGMFAGFEEDGIVGGITGAIEGFINSLLMAPLDMLKSAISWIAGAFGFEQAEAWLDSFSFEEMFSGLMDGLTDAILAIPEYIGNMVDWIGEKISEAMSFVSNVFDEFIIQPLSNFVTEYIIDPISSAFENISGFFTRIKDQLQMFLADFGIPAVEIDLPMLDPFTIGPFFPFRPEEGTEHISGATTSKTTSDSAGNIEESFIDNITNTRADGSTVMVQDMHTIDPITGQATATVGDSLVELDATTGRSTALIGDEEYEIDNSTFRTIKARAQEGNFTNAELKEIVAEDQAYNDERLTFWDRRKVDVGYASARDLLAQRIDEQSVDNAVARSAPAAGGGNTTIVNAPVSNSSSTTAAYRPNIRNPQPAVSPDFM